MENKKQKLTYVKKGTVALLGLLLAASTITSMGQIEIEQGINSSISIDNGECMTTNTSKICYTTLSIIGTDIDTNLPLQAVEKPFYGSESMSTIEVYKLIWNKG